MGLKSKNISVLISDGEHPLLTQVVYCLSKSSSIRVYVVSKNDKLRVKYNFPHKTESTIKSTHNSKKCTFSFNLKLFRRGFFLVLVTNIRCA